MVGKTVPAHACRIHQLELNHDKTVLYTTGVGDECVFKWNIEEAYPPIKGDDYEEDSRDLFGEVPLREEMEAQLALYHQKCKIQRPDGLPPSFLPHLKLWNIMGRNADRLRNNVKLAKGRPLYTTGHACVLDGPKAPQFIHLSAPGFEDLQEVSAIEVDSSGELLFMCHSGRRAGVTVWLIEAKMLLTKLYFN